MPSPELRCLECNRQFADLTADHDVERCGECGKFVVASPTLTMKAMPEPPEVVTADFASDDDIPTVGKAKPADDLPLAQPVRPPAPAVTLPAWAKRDTDPPAAPPRAEPPKAEPAKRADPFRPNLPPRPAATPTPRAEAKFADDPPAPVKKPRIGFALFVAFLFFVAMAAALGVLGYTIIRGLQMKKVITEAPAGQPAAFSRASDS